MSLPDGFKLVGPSLVRVASVSGIHVDSAQWTNRIWVLADGYSVHVDREPGETLEQTRDRVIALLWGEP